MRCRNLRRVLIFGVGVGVGLNVLAGPAFATPSTTNPSDAKFDCGVIDNLNQVTGHGANNNDGYQSTCDVTDFGGNGQEFGPGLQTGKPCAGCVGRADDKNPPGQFKDGSDPNSGYECDGRDRPSVNQNGNGNHGIGDENPAHTGCASQSVTPPDTNPTCPDGSAMPTTDQDGNGVINAADCNHPGDTTTPTCPDGSAMPTTDQDGNGVINAADCNHPGDTGDDTGGPGSTGGDGLGTSEVITTPPPVLAALLTVDLVAPSGVEAAVVTNDVAAAVPAAIPATPATPAQPAQVLAFTGVGTPTWVLALAAAFMIALGALLVRATRRPAIPH